jgi:Alkylmercury lyase/DprA winged helix domain
MAEMTPSTDQARSLLASGSEAARQVRQAGFAALLETKEPVGVDELAAWTSLGAEAVRGAIGELESMGLARVGPDGRLVGTAGLSVVPSRHRLELDGRVFHTWCALDAVGIPAALGVDARAATACPWCGRELALEIRAGEPTGLADAVIWLPSRSCTNVADELCPDMNMFCNEVHLRAWRSGRRDPPGRSLTVREAAALGRIWWNEMR